MGKPHDYRRRRVAMTGIAVLLLFAAERRAPSLASISIVVDERLVPRLDAAWSPPLAVAVERAGQIVALAQACAMQ